MGDEDPSNNTFLSVNHGPLLFSGLISLEDPKTVDPREQARELIAHYKYTLDRLGITFNDIVHITLYIKEDVDPLNLLVEYSKVIKGLPPAMTLVEVNNLPGNANYALAFIAFMEG